MADSLGTHSLVKIMVTVKLLTDVLGTHSFVTDEVVTDGKLFKGPSFAS